MFADALLRLLKYRTMDQIVGASRGFYIQLSRRPSHDLLQAIYHSLPSFVELLFDGAYLLTSDGDGRILLVRRRQSHPTINPHGEILQNQIDQWNIVV